MIKLSTWRYLLWRRLIQISVMLVFMAGNYLEWSILRGNYSAASVINQIPLADPFAAMQMLLAGAVMGVDILIGAAIVFVFYTVFFGRAFCSWICPLNLVIDLAHAVGKRLKLKFIEIRMSSSIRYYILAASLILSGILGYAVFELVNPISILHRGLIFGIGMGWGIIGAIFLIELIVKENVWCSKLCPLGGFYSVTTRYSLVKVYHKKDKCTNCDACFAVCPEVQVLDRVGHSSGFIRYGACTNCARCIEVCDDQALQFRIFGISRKR